MESEYRETNAAQKRLAARIRAAYTELTRFLIAKDLPSAMEVFRSLWGSKPNLWPDDEHRSTRPKWADDLMGLVGAIGTEADANALLAAANCIPVYIYISACGAGNLDMIRHLLRRLPTINLDGGMRAAIFNGKTEAADIVFAAGGRATAELACEACAAGNVEAALRTLDLLGRPATRTELDSMLTSALRANKKAAAEAMHAAGATMSAEVFLSACRPTSYERTSWSRELAVWALTLLGSRLSPAELDETLDKAGDCHSELSHQIRLLSSLSAALRVDRKAAIEAMNAADTALDAEVFRSVCRTGDCSLISWALGLLKRQLPPAELDAALDAASDCHPEAIRQIGLLRARK